LLEIEPDCFVRLKKLRKLSLSGNKLKSTFHAQTFRGREEVDQRHVYELPGEFRKRHKPVPEEKLKMSLEFM
jgi:hypothetical protein